jgi:sentrin-specific protease 8
VSQKITFLSPQVVQFIKSATNKQIKADVYSMLSSMNLKEKQLIIIPVNDCNINSEEMGGTHWSLLVYISDKQCFEHYDSHTGSINRYHAEDIVSILAPVLMPGRQSDLELDFTEMECTQQDNSYNCGVHVICNAEAVCRKYFRDDNRHISDISSPKAISRARRDIRKLIYSLKEKASNDKK